MTATTQPKAPNILIVDDMPANVLLLVRMLTQRGYQTRPVASGKLALEAARTEPPDLILLDINMPEMNGYEVCGQLKADAALKDIPVIFLSALNEEIDKVKAFSMGGVDYVTKPFQLEEVHARVETHLRLRSLQRQLSEQNKNLERLVLERTRELAQAYERVRELGSLKNDYLAMISHEIRTPAAGILGVGELLLDLCPASEDRTLYADLFKQSCLRLLNLIDDATLIADMQKLTLKSGVAISFPNLLKEVRVALPDIRILIEPSATLNTVFLKGYPPLLKKALESLILLVVSFSLDKQSAPMTVTDEVGVLRVWLVLDDLSLSDEQMADFFKIESDVRSASAAESLGLAPVVAHQIITSFGGELRLLKGKGKHDYLEAIFLKEKTLLNPSGESL